MKMSVHDEEAKNVITVLLDGKSVPMVFAFDDKEGWVESYVPLLPKKLWQSHPEEGVQQITANKFPTFSLKLVRRHGQVEVIFKNDTILDNRGDSES